MKVQHGRDSEQAIVAVGELLFPASSEHRLSSHSSKIPETSWDTSRALLGQNRPRRGRISGCRVPARSSDGLMLHS